MPVRSSKRLAASSVGGFDAEPTKSSKAPFPDERASPVNPVKIQRKGKQVKIARWTRLHMIVRLHHFVGLNLVVGCLQEIEALFHPGQYGPDLSHLEAEKESGKVRFFEGS